jgi:hypothetical protein
MSATQIKMERETVFKLRKKVQELESSCHFKDIVIEAQSHVLDLVREEMKATTKQYKSKLRTLRSKNEKLKVLAKASK